MYKRDYEKLKFLINTWTIGSFALLFIAVIILSRNLAGSAPPPFYRNIIAVYLFLYIPLIILGWLCLGHACGILTLIFSCLSIIYIVLKYFVLSYNSYIFLFGVAAVFGYRFFLKRSSDRNRYLIKREVYEGEKNSLAYEIENKESEIAAAKKRVLRYRALKNITEELSSTLELKKTAQVIADRAVDIIGNSDRSLLYLIDEQRQELELFSYRSAFQADRRAPDAAEVHTKMPELFDTWLLKQRKSLIVEDLDNDFRFSPEALRDASSKNFKSVIGVPLMSGMKAIGTLRMVSLQKKAYTQDDLRLLDIISDLAAVSLMNSRLYQQTNELAIKDGLTGLYVQRFFKEQLEVKVREAQRSGAVLAILMVDLDHFKTHNDKYGHMAGDLLLGRVAEVLRDRIGTGHIISRYGGEEFAVILTDTDHKKALAIAQNVRKGIEEADFIVRRERVKMTVSVGVSCFPKDAATPAALLKIADSNLYMAKEGGRNKVCSNS